MFDGEYKSGTAQGTGKKSNGWGGKYSYTYTYTVYGLTDISTGSDTFDTSDWDSWDADTQGTNANDTYESGGYGIELNDDDLTLLQDVENLTFGTAVTDIDTDTATDSSGAQLLSVIDNTEGAASIEQTIEFSAEQEVSSGSSISNGYSTTDSVEVGAEVSAEFAGIGVSYNTTVTESTTIDSSTTEETSETSTVTSTVSNTYTVEPGYKLQVKMVYESQEVTLPYTFPVSVSGTAEYSDSWGNTWSMDAGDNISSSINYGAPNADYMSASSSSEGELLATGYITNINASSFTTTQTVLVSPSSSSRRSERTGKLTPHVDLPTILKDGVEVEVGIHYDASETENAMGHNLVGSRYNDLIYMGSKNQKVKTFGGSDTVYGSDYADVIISRGDDLIFSGKGADVIKSTTGSTDIHAGPGKDRVNIGSRGGGFDDVSLGLGKDQINITLSKDDDYSFFIRDLHRKENVNIISDDSITAAVNGNIVEVSIDGDYVGSIGGYTERFSKLTYFKGAEMGLMNMDIIQSTASTDSVADWKNDLIAAGALIGWSSLNKNYKKFVKTGSEFTQNSEALSKYMYDGEIIEEFVDAMNDIIGDTDVTDMSDHVAKAVSQMSTDQQDHFVPDLLL